MCAAHAGTCVCARACVAMPEFVARHRVLTRGIALLSVQVPVASGSGRHGRGQAVVADVERHAQAALKRGDGQSEERARTEGQPA